jgi:hypothetical protein
MKTSNPFRASRTPLAFSASLLLAASVAQGQTSFSAFFNNGTGSFGNKTTAQYNWPTAVGAAGTITGLNDAGVSGGTTNTTGVPVVTGSTTAGFLFHVPVAEVASEAVLFHRTTFDTSDALQDAPQGSWYRSGTATLSGRTLAELTGLSVYTRSGSTATVMRFAVQTGGVWYASATSFTQSDLAVFEQKTINPVSENWIPNVGTPGTSLDTDLSDNGTPAPLDGASVITGYGWYADTDALTGADARVRIDSFVISSSASGPVAVPTSIVVTPAAAQVASSGTQQFSASLRDQSNQPIVPQPVSFSWSVSGGGSIDGNGLFTAGTTAGSFTVTANAESINGSTSFNVLPPVVSGSTVFSAYFNNGTGTGGDDDATPYNWTAAIGTGGVLDSTIPNATDDANVGVSQGVTTEGANAGVPLVAGESTKGGFLYALPDNNASGVSLLHTTHLTTADTLQDNPQPDWRRTGNASLNGLKVGEIDRLSIYTRPATTATTMRFAILAGGQWYLSATAFNQSNIAVYELRTLNNLTAANAWYSNVFTAGSSLDDNVADNPTATLSADALVTGYGWYADTDAQTSTNSRVRVDSFQVTTVVFSGGSAYEMWAGGTFANAFPEGQRGAEIDYDNDGLNNLLEFVLGGDPTINDSPSVRPNGVVSGANLVVTFNRSDASELQPVAVKVQVSNDLVTWNPADDISIGAVGNAGPIGGTGASYTVNDSGSIDTIVVTIPKGAAAKKFARVVATQ